MKMGYFDSRPVGKMDFDSDSDNDEYVPPSEMEVGGQDATSLDEKQLQQERLEACISLLLSAGYFRARLPKVEPFDKVSITHVAPLLDYVDFPCLQCTSAYLIKFAGGWRACLGNRLVRGRP